MPDVGDPQVGEEGRHTQELAALYAVSAAMNQALDEEQALSQALSRVLQVMALESGRIYLLDDKTQQLALVTAAGNPLFLDPDEATIRPGECLCGLAANGGEPLVALDACDDQRDIRPNCRRYEQHGCASVPLLAKDRVLGVLHVVTRQGISLSSAEIALLRSAAAQIGFATENMRLREEARRAEALSALIAEMHHRIKNNLQTVADLLSLEMLNSTSPEARRSLHDSINRIKSIAVVHRLLSIEQLRLTDITELARQVSAVALGHLTRPGQQVQAEVTGSPIYLPSKQATALALVMNELIANALEHGFSDGLSGLILVGLQQEGPRISVTIVDGGHGLPPGFDLAKHSGLGLQIVRTLVEKDLAGTLQLERLPAGSCATVTFYR